MFVNWIEPNVAKVEDIAGKKLAKRHIAGPLGVRGRNSDNNLIAEKLGWRPTKPLKAGLEQTYKWIEKHVKMKNKMGKLD